MLWFKWELALVLHIMEVMEEEDVGGVRLRAAPCQICVGDLTMLHMRMLFWSRSLEGLHGHMINPPLTLMVFGRPLQDLRPRN
jgi:hypothetical protein